MRVLCVAEKPSISKSITQILSGGHFNSRPSRNKYIKNYDFPYRLPAPLGNDRDADFTVTAVLGHLTGTEFDDNHRKWQSCDPFALFDAPIHTTVSSELRDVEKNLQDGARNADLLLIWTDCDREGEHIGSEVAAVCRKVNRGLVVKRARFSAIIAAQIHQACRNANDLDMRQAQAVETRIALDLRIGAAFTRLTTMSIQPQVPETAEQVISYGPCQFPTLGFVVDQWNKVQNFVSETFWYINVAIEREDENDASKLELVDFKWRRNHLFDLEAVMALYGLCMENPMATVTSVETKPTTKWKPLPLTTVELQQSGSRLLHMTPKRILDLAEKLYQKGFLSYPRTETDQYDKAFDFQTLIQKQTLDREWGDFATRLVNGEFQRPRNGRKNDKAHPPIHPTASASNLDADERRVYELVTRRFLASCHSNAEGKTTTVEIDTAGERFFTSGLVVIRRNYLDVYPYDKWASTTLPDFDEGEHFMPSVCEIKEGSTSRPSLLTEADLVGLMDKNGIGTDATIAEHIAKVVERKYVIEKPEGKTKYLVPSPLGIGLVEGFNAIGFDRSLSKPHLRAETEHRMQLICDGDKTKTEVLDTTIEEYKEVYIKAKREFNTVIESVKNFINGQGPEQEAVRAAARGGGRGRRGAARGGRGGRGRGGGEGAAPRRRDDDDDDEDDSDDHRPQGGAAGIGRRGRGAATTTRVTTRGRGRGRGGGAGTSYNDNDNDNHDHSNDNAANGNKTCNCGTEAVKRTVTSNAKGNQGREFYTCSKPQDESCGYFEWADAGSTNGSGRSTAPAPRAAAPRSPPRKRNRTEYEDEEGTVRCECGLEARFGTTSKGPNMGRSFWTCPNNKRAQCGFFEWAEEGDTGPPQNDRDRGGSSSRTRARGSKISRGKTRGRGRGRGGASGGGGASDECYKCHETGHWASNCPNG